MLLCTIEKVCTVHNKLTGLGLVEEHLPLALGVLELALPPAVLVRMVGCRVNGRRQGRPVVGLMMELGLLLGGAVDALEGRPLRGYRRRSAGRPRHRRRGRPVITSVLHEDGGGLLMRLMMMVMMMGGRAAKSREQDRPCAGGGPEPGDSLLELVAVAG